MKWGMLGMSALTLAIACGDGKKKAPAEDRPPGGSPMEPATRTAEKGTAASSESEPSALAPTAAPQVTAKRDAFDAWLATQSADAKQVPAGELPADLSAGLLALAKGVLSKPQEVELRWARALGSAAVAFSFHHPPPDYGPDGYWFAVATAYPERGVFGAHDATFVAIIEDGNNDFGPGASRDLDGDGVPDLVIEYGTEISGGGERSSSGLVLLGSRGGALQLELESRDADWETEGECNDDQTKPELACWTELHGRALLVAVIADRDACTETVRSRDYVAVRARADGTLGVADAYAVIEARGTLAALERWRGGPGAKKGDAADRDEPSVEPAACAAGSLIVPFETAHALIGGFASEPPAGSSIHFEAPAKDASADGDKGKTKAAAAKLASPPPVSAPGAGSDGRKELTAAQLDAYKKELRQGRNLGKKKQHAEAAAAFERALAIKAGDPRANSELGWTALQLGEIDRSIAASRASVEAASDRRLKAASLYNLGLALEQKKDRSGAIAAFRESFDQRPNQAVYKKLAALDATTDADLVAPRPMPGPYASVAAYCREWLKQHPAPPDSQDGEGWACGPNERPYTEKYEWLAAAPFEELVLFSHETDWTWTYRVAMKTKAGWFISPATWTRETNADYGSFDHITVEPGGVLSLAWTFEQNARDRSAEVSPYWKSSYLVVCGADDNARVSCTPTLEIGYDQGGDGEEELAWQVDVKLTPKQLVLTSADSDLPKHIEPLLGAHAIAFQ